MKPFKSDLHNKKVPKLKSCAVAMFLDLYRLRNPSVPHLSEDVLGDKMAGRPMDVWSDTADDVGGCCLDPRQEIRQGVLNKQGNSVIIDSRKSSSYSRGCCLYHP